MGAREYINARKSGERERERAREKVVLSVSKGWAPRLGALCPVGALLLGPRERAPHACSTRENIPKVRVNRKRGSEREVEVKEPFFAQARTYVVFSAFW